MLITFEGIDGAGKTTQSLKLYEYLRGRRRAVSLYREPGGTAVSEMLRNILLGERTTPQTELLLFEAARAELVLKKVLPDLQSGAVVIIDRFTDSTLAYQGFGRGIDLDFIKELNRFATNGLEPDITFLLDVEPEIALTRLRGKTKFENLSFLKRVRDGYIEIAKEHPERIVVLPSHPHTEEVFRQIIEILRSRLNF